MHERGVVAYVDAQSKTHDALVRTINPMHPGRLTLVYLADDAEPVTVFDVAHKDDESRANLRQVIANGPTPEHGTTVTDGNPNLPHFDVNVWMERDEQHNPLPADHPAFDHPWKQPEFDQAGNRIPVVRTEYERVVEEHLHPSPKPPAPPARQDAFSIENAKLKQFLMENFKNETGDETPVDCAIRLLSKRQKKEK